jgi:hypothetical protein
MMTEYSQLLTIDTKKEVNAEKLEQSQIYLEERAKQVSEAITELLKEERHGLEDMIKKYRNKIANRKDDVDDKMQFDEKPLRFKTFEELFSSDLV